MTTREMGIEEARAKLGDLVLDAQRDGTATMITRHGTPAAILMPLHPAEKHDDPEMRGTLVKSLAQYILRGQMHTKRPDYTDAQILARARYEINDMIQYGYVFGDGEDVRIASDAKALASKVQDTDPDWTQWAHGR